MPRPSPYTDAQKSAILEAVKSARKTGTWPDALKAAQEAGFKGGLQYLMKFAGGSKRRGRKPGEAAAAAAAAKVRHPKGAGKRGPGRLKASAILNGSGLAGIDRIVASMVTERLTAKIGAAVKALERAAGELRNIGQ